MAQEHPIRDAGLAVSLLTIVPTGTRWPEEPTQSAAWFPLVGALIGAVGYAEAHAANAVQATAHSSLLVAAVIVTTWALLTRFLHWDGLADTADGFWGGADVARRLEIMSDSHTGAFGATAVTLGAILEVAALASILQAPHELPVLLVPVFARFSATAAAWLGTPARDGGLGRSVMGPPTMLSAFIGGGVVLAAALVFGFAMGPAGLLFGAVALVVALAVPHLLAGRFGGVTGDVMGASVLLTEIVLFVAFALVW